MLFDKQDISHVKQVTGDPLSLVFVFYNGLVLSLFSQPWLLFQPLGGKLSKGTQ
jgi:hypothetical protein